MVRLIALYWCTDQLSVWYVQSCTKPYQMYWHMVGRIDVPPILVSYQYVPPISSGTEQYDKLCFNVFLRFGWMLLNVFVIFWIWNNMKLMYCVIFIFMIVFLLNYIFYNSYIDECLISLGRELRVSCILKPWCLVLIDVIGPRLTWYVFTNNGLPHVGMLINASVFNKKPKK